MLTRTGQAMWKPHIGAVKNFVQLDYEIGESVELIDRVNPTQKSSLDVAEDAECSGDENLNCMHLPMKKWRELITKVMKPL